MGHLRLRSKFSVLFFAGVYCIVVGPSIILQGKAPSFYICITIYWLNSDLLKPAHALITPTNFFMSLTFIIISEVISHTLLHNKNNHIISNSTSALYIHFKLIILRSFYLSPFIAWVYNVVLDYFKFSPINM